MWWFGERKRREQAAREAQAQAALYVRPPVLNPAAHEHLSFAEWRAAHIQRWLDDNPDAPDERRNYLHAERDMHLAVLRQHGRDV